MPPRSLKMNRFIFGFQRRGWGAEGGPGPRRPPLGGAAPGLPFCWGGGVAGGGGGSGGRCGPRPPPPPAPRGGGGGGRGGGTDRALDAPGPTVLPGPRGGGRGAASLAEAVQKPPQLRRERRLELEPLAGERMVEREPRRVQKLALEAVVRDAVDRV